MSGRYVSLDGASWKQVTDGSGIVLLGALPEIPATKVTGVLDRSRVPFNVAAGSITITPSGANTPTSGHVTYPFTFAVAPNVVATPISAVPGTQITGVGVSNNSTTGCDIYLTRSNTTSSGVFWIAAL